MEELSLKNKKVKLCSNKNRDRSNLKSEIKTNKHRVIGILKEKEKLKVEHSWKEN